MAQQTIDLGSAPNDGTGDPIRTGGDKINDNFTELYDVNTANALETTAGRFVANNTDDSGTPDAAYLVDRTLDGAVLPSGHGFRDQTVFSRDTYAYACFDGAVAMTGPNLDFDHAVSFQSRIEMDNSGGTLINAYGVFNQHIITAGTITNAIGIFCEDATGAGAITNQYGLYVAPQTKGSTLNYAVYTEGTTPSVFGGNVRCDGDVSCGVANGFYVGTGSVNGDWRFIISGDDLLIQQREAGSFVTKSTISGA